MRNQPSLLASVPESINAYRVRMVVAVQTVFIGCALVVLATFLTSSSVVVVTAMAISCLASLVSLVLVRKGHIGWGVWILGLQFLVLSTGLSLRAHGMYDSAMLVFPTGMITLAVVDRPGRTALFSLVSFGCALVVTWLTWKGDVGMPLQIDPSSMLRDGVVVLVLLAFGGSLSTYISSLLNRLLGGLERHQADLEAQVLQRTADLTLARDKLVQNEKLAALGKLVAGVAHELNTPLGNATVLATSLQESIDDLRHHPRDPQGLQNFVEAQRERLEVLVRSLGRASALVARFKQIAVDQTSDRRRQSRVEELFADLALSFEIEFKGQPWVLSTEVAPDLELDGYPGALMQILTNLVQNAVFHGFKDRDAGTVKVVAKKRADLIEVEVVDNGRGIPSASLARVFEPFYTTRLGQGGSGLGLTICHNMATGPLGGTLEVHSTEGTGTRFVLTIPARSPGA